MFSASRRLHDHVLLQSSVDLSEHDHGLLQSSVDLSEHDHVLLQSSVDLSEHDNLTTSACNVWARSIDMPKGGAYADPHLCGG